MSKIAVVQSDRIIQVHSPYHPDLPKQARNLGGIWTGDAWAFDANRIEEVRELYRSVFGEFEETGSK